MNNELEIRDDRQRAILALLRRRPVHRQEELVAKLAERGFEVTQSSVSRDLRQLGVAKVGGRYVAPAAAQGAPDPLADAAHLLRRAGRPGRT